MVESDFSKRKRATNCDLLIYIRQKRKRRCKYEKIFYVYIRGESLDEKVVIPVD